MSFKKFGVLKEFSGFGDFKYLDGFGHFDCLQFLSGASGINSILNVKVVDDRTGSIIVYDHEGNMSDFEKDFATFVERLSQIVVGKLNGYIVIDRGDDTFVKIDVVDNDVYTVEGKVVFPLEDRVKLNETDEILNAFLEMMDDEYREKISSEQNSLYSGLSEKKIAEYRAFFEETIRELKEDRDNSPFPRDLLLKEFDSYVVHELTAEEAGKLNASYSNSSNPSVSNSGKTNSDDSPDDFDNEEDVL